MNKLLTVFLFALCFRFAHGQEEPGERRGAREEYCVMTLTEEDLRRPGLTIAVDFGQKLHFWKDVRTVRDERGRPIVFNSLADALNYMASDGWELVNVYSFTDGKQTLFHYVMRRKLAEEDKKEN